MPATPTEPAAAMVGTVSACCGESPAAVSKRSGGDKARQAASHLRHGRWRRAAGGRGKGLSFGRDPGRDRRRVAEAARLRCPASKGPARMRASSCGSSLLFWVQPARRTCWNFWDLLAGQTFLSQENKHTFILQSCIISVSRAA